MTLWAVVPVKPLRQGKSRLRDVLPDEDRVVFNRCLLEHTLDVLKSISEIAHVLVISKDPQALALSRSRQAHTVMEDGSPNLNVALERAKAIVRGYIGGRLLILPADLPLLSTEDIAIMINAAVPPPAVVIAPDRHKRGTNALLINPVGLIHFEFGPGSFQRHCDQAVQAGARLQVIDRPSLGLDIDLPEDLDLVRQIMGKSSGLREPGGNLSSCVERVTVNKEEEK